MTTRSIRTAVAIVVVAAPAASLALSAPATASASLGCRAPMRHPFPAVSGLSASHTTCAAASSVAEHIQGVWQTSNGSFPGWFQIKHGGPWWHCSYRMRGQARHRSHDASCTAGRAIVTMRLAA